MASGETFRAGLQRKPHTVYSWLLDINFGNFAYPSHDKKILNGKRARLRSRALDRKRQRKHTLDKSRFAASVKLGWWSSGLKKPGLVNVARLHHVIGKS